MQHMGPPRMARRAVALHPRGDRQIGQVVVDVGQQRQGARPRLGADLFARTAKAETRQDYGGWVGLVEHLLDHRASAGPGARGRVGSQRRLLDDADRRAALASRPRQALDEGDRLGRAQHVGEDQEPDRRPAGEGIGKGRGQGRLCVGQALDGGLPVARVACTAAHCGGQDRPLGCAPSDAAGP